MLIIYIGHISTLGMWLSMKSLVSANTGNYSDVDDSNDVVVSAMDKWPSYRNSKKPYQNLASSY